MRKTLPANLVRQPVVAGRFYPENSVRLRQEVEYYLDAGGKLARPAAHKGQPWALMLPHAGYMYCGHVIGATLARVSLPDTLVILCPNHTGQGHHLGVWPGGEWLTPCDRFVIDESLAETIIESHGGFAADIACHAVEHSIEVLLPFLGRFTKAPTRIVPICVGTQQPEILQQAGDALGKALAQRHTGGKEAGVVVSSDMNHYEDEKTTVRKDALALAQVIECNPRGLLETTARQRISMCGSGPMALALFAAISLGWRPEGELLCHDTSATASGDKAHTVGYAGLHFYLA